MDQFKWRCVGDEEDDDSGKTYLLYHSQAGIQIKQCTDHWQGGDIGILTTNAVSNGDYWNAGLWARSLLIEVCDADIGQYVYVSVRSLAENSTIQERSRGRELLLHEMHESWWGQPTRIANCDKLSLVRWLIWTNAGESGAFGDFFKTCNCRIYCNAL